ncbi:MAG: dynamin family protein [Cyanobacteria bacterium P01_H01_bin.35]
MINFEIQKKAVLKLFQDSLFIAEKLKKSDSLQYLKSAYSRLIDEKIWIVICGEYKKGKSSLTNALLNEPGLFPVDVDVTTSLVSTITHGEREKIMVVLGKPGEEKSKNIEITREEISDYVTEQKNKNNTKNARMLVIESPNQQLENGLVLVDTPGVGGLNTNHTDITYAFIPNADVILFVSDVDKPLSQPELDFIKMIREHNQNLVYVVTKTDLVDENNYEAIVENNRQKLTKISQCSPEEITIIPVSSKNKLDYLKTKDVEDLEDSNFTKLEDKIWQILNQEKGYILLMSALGSINQVIVEMKTPLQAEWKACQKQTKEELDALENKFETEKKRLEELINNQNTWNNQLRDGMTDMRQEVMYSFEEGFSKIRRQLNDYIEGMPDKPQKIASLIETEIDALISRLGKELSQTAQLIYKDLEYSTQLNLNPLEVTSLESSAAKISTNDINLKDSDWFDKASTATRSGFMNGFSMAVVGGAIGWVVGLPFGGVGSAPGTAIGASIGATLGQVAGFFRGAKKSWEELDKKDQIENQRIIAKKINPIIEDSQKQSRKILNDAITKLERFMRDEFSGQIQRQKKTYEESLNSIKRSRDLSQQDAARRSQQLQKPLEYLNGIYQRGAEIGKEIEKWQTSQSNDKTDVGGWADA